MGSNNTERRKKLFELYAANLAFYAPAEYAGKFACPICGDMYWPAAVNPETLDVDLAHVYPESCGGTLVTLTCKTCNSRLGTKYDKQLTIEHRGHEGMAEGSQNPVAARIVFDGGSVGVRVNRAGEGYQFRVVDKWTNPAEGEALKAHLLTPNSAFNLQMRWIDKDRHNVAVLHSAYLALFREYGYEFVAFADTEWIRQILRADEPPTDPFFMTMPVPADSDLDPKFIYATGIAEYRGQRYLAVVLPSPEPAQKARIVILPGIGKESAEAYRKLLRMPEPTEPVPTRYNFRYGIPEKRLADSKGVGFLHRIWNSPIP